MCSEWTRSVGHADVTGTAKDSGLTAGLEKWQETAYLGSGGWSSSRRGRADADMIPAASVPAWHRPQHSVRSLDPVALEKP